jgi:N-acetylmuramoyl-L-alanine amidase
VEWITFGRVGPEVEDVQRRLADLGLGCTDDPGVFAEGTRASVRAFQQRRGLVADGVVGEDTWHALVGAGFRPGDRLLYLTQPPMHGDDVREVQQRLNRLGFECGYDDGIYGERTASAIRDFQLNVGMAVDGIAGPQTFDLLSRLHRHHQEAPVYVVREREALRRDPRPSLVGARIMVDPAHSVEHPGVTGPDGVTEHDVTWQIATLVDGRLRALGASVMLSRGPGSVSTPSERARYANDEDVEAILSIHVNGDRSPTAQGVAAYHFGTDAYISERGRALAELAVERLVGATGTADCRVHASTSALLRESRAPAVIVEVGFLTHPEEGRLLTSLEGQRTVADAIVDAIVAFLLEPARAA